MHGFIIHQGQTFIELLLNAKHPPKYVTCTNNFHCRVGAIVNPVLEARNLKHGDIKWLAQCLGASK